MFAEPMETPGAQKKCSILITTENFTDYFETHTALNAKKDTLQSDKAYVNSLPSSVTAQPRTYRSRALIYSQYTTTAIVKTKAESGTTAS